MIIKKRGLVGQLKHVYRGFRYGFSYWWNERYHNQISRRLRARRRIEKYGRTLGRRYNNGRKWRLIKARGSICQMCKRSFVPSDLTVDHKKRVADGGTNAWNNLQLLCRPCHD